MAQQIFAYVLYNGGIADDSTLEMVAAARKIDPQAAVTAVVAGSGADVDKVGNDITTSFQEVWKVDHDALVYPNAEVIRGILARILPKDAIVLVPHEHFGMDLSPGLSIKLDAPYVPDVVDFEGIADGKLKVVREEYAGQVSTHVSCDISDGAVITVRPGSFQPEESKGANGQVVDKTAEAVEGGVPGGGRRYLELVEALAMWILPNLRFWSPWDGASKMKIILTRNRSGRGHGRGCCVFPADCRR
jgi:electron transfer flavoprotein alpha subunit